MLGASLDPLERQDKFAAKEKLTFPLLADEKAAVAKKYGVYGRKKLYGREYWGVTRSTFVIGPDGNIAKIWPKVKVKDHVAEVLAFVKTLGQE